MASIYHLRQITLYLSLLSVCCLIASLFVQHEILEWLYGISASLSIVIGTGTLLLMVYGTLQKYEMGPALRHTTVLIGAILVSVAGAILRLSCTWSS